MTTNDSQNTSAPPFTRVCTDKDCPSHGSIVREMAELREALADLIDQVHKFRALWSAKGEDPDDQDETESKKNLEIPS